MNFQIFFNPFSYFVAHILEFEFYRSLCIVANEYVPTDPDTKPLHKCDFFNSEEAGDKLRAGLELGASEPWTVALEALTGDTEITGNAILEYFKPLYDFLVIENQKVEEEYVKQVLQSYNDEATNQCNILVKASWDVATDTLNLEKQAALAQAVVENARFVKDNYETHFKELQSDQFMDVSVQRQVMFLSKLGTDILEEEDLLEVGFLTYSIAKCCIFKTNELTNMAMGYNYR
jgi:peptidyl-dipeptidase A